LSWTPCIKYSAAPGHPAFPARYSKHNADFFCTVLAYPRWYRSTRSICVKLDELRRAHPTRRIYARNHAHNTPSSSFNSPLPQASSFRLKCSDGIAPWIRHGWPRFQPTSAYSLIAGTRSYRTHGTCHHWGCTRRLSIDGTLVPLVI